MKGRIGRSGFGIGAALRGVLVFGFGQDIYDLELWPLSEDFASAGDEFARRPDSGISGANSGAPLRGFVALESWLHHPRHDAGEAPGPHGGALRDQWHGHAPLPVSVWLGKGGDVELQGQGRESYGCESQQ